VKKFELHDLGYEGVGAVYKDLPEGKKRHQHPKREPIGVDNG